MQSSPFSLRFDPSKIKSGTKGGIIRTKKGKNLGFYLHKSKSKSFITYLSATGYETIMVATNKLDDIINENIETSAQKGIKVNSTRISLLNAPQLIKKKNIKITKGNNLFNALIKEGVDSKQIGNLLNSLKKYITLKELGQNRKLL